MSKKTLNFWIVASLAAWIIGYAGKAMVKENEIFFFLYMFGWISSMLAVGYYSKPDHIVFGKIVYGFVVVMIVGIIFKILHLTGADELIMIGLICVGATYAVMWIQNKRAARH